MINRVLIRIKVVQMLYSYLLTRSEFKIESAPENPSRDKKYAYQLYIDLLLLMLQLSGFKVQGSSRLSPMHGIGENRYLSSNKVVRALMADEDIRSLILKQSGRMPDYDSVTPDIYNAILQSSAYRSYIRLKQRDLKEDAAFWANIVSSIIAKDPRFMAAARKNPDFTNVGFDLGVAMLLNTISSYSDNRMLLTEARNSLDRSLDKAYELYHSLLLLCVEITRMQDQRLDAAKHKYLPSHEDLNPDMRFVDNALPKYIAENASMEEYLKDHPISWADDDILVKRLLEEILASDLYKEYMAAPTTDFEADCEFWRSVYKNIILPSDDLAEALESKSVYWNDDLHIMGTFVLKTLKRISTGEGKQMALLAKYKDDEDAAFGPKLFLDSVTNREEYRTYIDRFINSSHWDPERLAFMDIVIMIAAIAELLNFPTIPIPVTLNEYIEIANYYSTPKSGQFINGILYSVVNSLKSEGKLLKD